MCYPPPCSRVTHALTVASQGCLGRRCMRSGCQPDHPPQMVKSCSQRALNLDPKARVTSTCIKHLLAERLLSRIAMATTFTKMDSKHPPTGSRARPWQPGSFRHAPHLAFGALGASLVISGLALFVIRFADGKAVEDWTVAPNVYLSILATLSAMMLRFAFHDGAEMYWWTDAALLEVWCQASYAPQCVAAQPRPYITIYPDARCGTGLAECWHRSLASRDTRPLVAASGGCRACR